MILLLKTREKGEVENYKVVFDEILQYKKATDQLFTKRSHKISDVPYLFQSFSGSQRRILENNSKKFVLSKQTLTDVEILIEFMPSLISVILNQGSFAEK